MFAVINLKFKQGHFYHREIYPKCVDRIANSADPDQTAPIGAVLSGSTLFAQTCLSENLRLLWYYNIYAVTKQVPIRLHRYVELQKVEPSQCDTYEQRHEKTNVSHMRKQRRRSASQ